MRKGQTREFWWTREKVEKMHEMRVSEDLSLEEVAQRYGIRRQRVQQLYKKFGIPSFRRHRSQKLKDEWFINRVSISKETLIDLYVDQQLRIDELTMRLNTTASILYRCLKIYGIPKRPANVNQPRSPLTHDLLYKMYIEEKRAAGEIARELNYAPITIQRRLSQFGIRKYKKS